MSGGGPAGESGHRGGPRDDRRRHGAPGRRRRGPGRGARLAHARLHLHRPAGYREARRGASLRRRAARRGLPGSRRGPPARARRPLAASRPRLARAARRPAPGRDGPRAGDRRRRLPAVRGRSPRLRDRRCGGDGGGEPERAAEDARGTGPVRPPHPDHGRARGAARDRALALPRDPLRAAGAGRSRPSSSPSARPTRRRPSGSPPPAWPVATSSWPRASARRSGASCARRSPRAPAPRARAELGDRPWERLLEVAGEGGEQAGAALDGRRASSGRGGGGVARARPPAGASARARRPPAGPRAGRGPRPSISAWGCWPHGFATSPPSAEGAPELILNVDRSERARRGRGGARRAPCPARRGAGDGHPAAPAR